MYSLRRTSSEAEVGSFVAGCGGAGAGAAVHAWRINTEDGVIEQARGAHGFPASLVLRNIYVLALQPVR